MSEHDKSLKKVHGITVTDHAILRYLERVHNVDVEGIRTNLITRTMANKIHKLKGDGEWSLRNGYRLVFKNYALVTIIPPQGR